MKSPWTIDAVRKADHSYWDIMTAPDASRVEIARLDFHRAMFDHAIKYWRMYGFYSIVEKGGA